MIAPPASIRWCAVVLTLVVSLYISPTPAIYCDEDDCYDLLGSAPSQTSLPFHHPDKNPDPKSRKLFVKIGNSYEILKDEATREQYDYAIAHQEEMNFKFLFKAFWKYIMLCDMRTVFFLWLYHSCYYHGSFDFTAVDLTLYNQAVDKNSLRALELERSGGTTNMKKSNRQMDKKKEEDLSKELELDIKGAEKPFIWELIGVRFILLPYTIGKAHYMQIKNNPNPVTQDQQWTNPTRSPDPSPQPEANLEQPELSATRCKLEFSNPSPNFSAQRRKQNCMPLPRSSQQQTTILKKEEDGSQNYSDRGEHVKAQRELEDKINQSSRSTLDAITKSHESLVDQIMAKLSGLHQTSAPGAGSSEGEAVCTDLEDTLLRALVAITSESFSYLVMAGEIIKSAIKHGKIKDGEAIKKPPIRERGGEINNINQVNMGVTISNPKSVAAVPLVSPYPVEPMKHPYPKWYDENAHCEYHGGVLGHNIENCYTFKRIMQKMRNQNWINFNNLGASK
ncbi:hypothetical protein F3Y22_tig00111783pilonHSYRG00428 [Hibiscus syriacus]|uniref:J domain-containing protein n=1 Tax=Hibiscus syriacus TaxID=106335 RepID=A0A6A2XCM9_HIBSY|nr:hypothetical protein F3Y22_tig00111783pilonHSYRG00428 [Hibiscus syriacus]